MENRDVKIGLIENSEVEFELYGEYTALENNNLYGGKYKASLEKNKLIVSGGPVPEYLDGLTLIPVDYDAESFILHDIYIGKNFHWEKKESQRFAGTLQLIKHKNQIIAINILPIEDYVMSVISSEMNPAASVEFLKAQAVIARSWLFSQFELQNGKSASFDIPAVSGDDEMIRWYNREDHKLYDVCNDDHCQRYQGLTKLPSDHVRNAVESTFGLVLHVKNKICDTRYSKACGGITEAYENVWDPVEHSYLKSIIDYKFEPDGFDLNLKKESAAEVWINSSPSVFCNTKDKKLLSQVLVNYDQKTSDFFRWKREFTQTEISSLIKKNTGIEFGEIKELLPIERGYSGRIIKLKIEGTNNTMVIGKELEIRRILSDSHLYSSAFTVSGLNKIKGIPQQFIIKGAGWGHGVGLCQIGAAVMAQKGYNFDEILLHYYPGSQIKRLYR